MDDEVKRGVWRHFKGKEYLVEGEFPDTETGEVHIAYRQLYSPFKKCSRAKTNFLEIVDRPDFSYKVRAFSSCTPFDQRRFSFLPSFLSSRPGSRDPERSIAAVFLASGPRVKPGVT